MCYCYPAGKEKRDQIVYYMSLKYDQLYQSLGSKVYWSAIMSTAIICINVSYGLPYVCRLIWSRDKLPKGPFNLGKWSIPVNVAAVTWVVFFSVILCIPSTNPVNPVTMNWSCLMVGAAFLLSLVFWYTYGQKNYQGPVQTLQGDSK